MEFDLDGVPIFKVLFDRVWPNFGTDRVLLPFYIEVCTRATLGQEVWVTFDQSSYASLLQNE